MKCIALIYIYIYAPMNVLKYIYNIFPPKNKNTTCRHQNTYTLRTIKHRVTRAIRRTSIKTISSGKASNTARIIYIYRKIN